MSRKNCRNYETVNFYCINCGSKGIPIARMGNNRKDKGHRKNMYCPTCRHTVNHIECRNEFEEQQFIEDFNNGVYKDEALAELEYEATCPRLSVIYNGGSAGIGQVNLCAQAIS